MTVVSFREYERIPVVEALSSPTKRALSVAEINQLDALAVRLKIQVIEHLSRSRVRPAQYVGAVQLGGRRVEFLPKIEQTEVEADLPAPCSGAPGGSHFWWQAKRSGSLRTRRNGCRRRPKPSVRSSSASGRIFSASR